MSAHTQLKQATAAAHDRVDAAFAAFDLSRPDQYGAFLQRHAAAFIPAENALTRAGADAMIGGWIDHLRARALLSDLSELGLGMPDPVAAPAYVDDSALWGGAYVLEGSRLGGAVLRRSVAPGLPRAFLDSVQPPGRWRAFIAELNRRLSDPDKIEIATKSALETFSLFEVAGAVRAE